MFCSQLHPRTTRVVTFCTSNKTSHHRGPKRKPRAGYRAPSLQRTLYLCALHCCCYVRPVIFHCQVWYCTLSLCMGMLCAYSTFGHNPHPLGYTCAKFHFSCLLTHPSVCDPAYLVWWELKPSLRNKLSDVLLSYCNDCCVYLDECKEGLPLSAIRNVQHEFSVQAIQCRTQ